MTPLLPQQAWTIQARWLFPVCAPPLENGTVTIADGRIVAVDKRGPRPVDLDLGNVAITPGLVNAHTHLDLTRLPAAPAPDFTAWLQDVIAYRRRRSPEQVQDDIRAGIAESLRFGTTLLGDISAGGASWDILAQAPLRAVVYHELLGLPRHRADNALRQAKEWLNSRSGSASCRPGLSPHAPYSVSRWLFQSAAREALDRHLPLAIHLAETLAERDLLASHQGPFVPFLADLAVLDADELVGSWEEVLQLHARAAPLAYAHGNYLDRRIAIPPGATIVYCPRTHAAFGHPPHPFRDFLDRGISVALGTDSLSRDVLAEARFLRKLHPELPGNVLLTMATLAGARALGWDKETGSLQPGKSADLIVLPVPDCDSGDPHELILASDVPVDSVLFAGRSVRTGSCL